MKSRSVITSEALSEKLRALGATEGVVWNEDTPGDRGTFFSQLNHMKEAERILQLADLGGHFDDLYTRATDPSETFTVVEMNNALVARAEEILAEEFPDVQVRVRSTFGHRGPAWGRQDQGAKRTHFVCVGRGVNAKFPSPKNEDVTAKLEAMCSRKR